MQKEIRGLAGCLGYSVFELGFVEMEGEEKERFLGSGLAGWGRGG